MMTSKNILKPSFLIIGGVKCASSSLYRYLNDHPQVLPCKVKEPGYFNFTNPLVLLKKYRSYIDNFPDLNQANAVGDWIELESDGSLSESTFEKPILPNVDYITGEATATTMVRANPRIVKRVFPKVKIIALVRNPTDRFISHYQMIKRFDESGRAGNDVGSLDQFVEDEISKLNKKKPTRILEQGFYAEYLARWEYVFEQDVRVIASTQLNDETSNATMNALTEFLNLYNHDYSNILQQRFNQNKKTNNVNQEARDTLDKVYHKHNIALKEKYGINYL